VDCRVQLGSLQVELAGTLGELDWCGIKMEGGHLRLTGSGLRVRAGLGDRVAGCRLGRAVQCGCDSDYMSRAQQSESAMIYADQRRASSCVKCQTWTRRHSQNAAYKYANDTRGFRMVYTSEGTGFAARVTESPSSGFPFITERYSSWAGPL
jgi:hypothetical protein